MKVTQLLKALVSTVSALFRSKGGRRRARSYGMFISDAFEPRLLMTAYHWVGGAGSSFISKSNWRDNGGEQPLNDIE